MAVSNSGEGRYGALFLVVILVFILVRMVKRVCATVAGKTFIALPCRVKE